MDSKVEKVEKVDKKKGKSGKENTKTEDKKEQEVRPLSNKVCFYLTYFHYFLTKFITITIIIGN